MSDIGQNYSRTTDAMKGQKYHTHFPFVAWQNLFHDVIHSFTHSSIHPSSSAQPPTKGPGLMLGLNIKDKLIPCLEMTQSP